MVFWFTGLSGSGKTTLCKFLSNHLRQMGRPTLYLDGDLVRSSLCEDLGFTLDDRRENVRRIAACASLAEQSGIIACVACISPLRAHRDMAAQIVNSFHEIYVSCDLNVCRQRDPKGYYRDASQGTRQLYTGISSPYETPLKAELVLETDKEPEEYSKSRLLNFVNLILS